MIVAFTDFGFDGPYLGQVRIEVLRRAPGVPFVDLIADAPKCDPRSAAYLLAALVPRLPKEVIVLGVVDPGVGTDRNPIVARAGDRWFVGPDNGLFDGVVHPDPDARTWRIAWRPLDLSASFHGRDLFAPVAARLAVGESIESSWLQPVELTRRQWPLDLSEVIYVDHYGNCLTGIRGANVSDQDELTVGDHRLSRAEIFGAVDPGHAFWYRNSLGLVEIAVNLGSAARQLSLAVGSPLNVVGGS